MANGWQTKTAHFVLHQWQDRGETKTGPGFEKAPALLIGKHLGIVVPKRLAKKAVTRNLIRRQVRELVQREQEHLPDALYVVRLKTPFSSREFVSAASPMLKQGIRAELTQLLEKLKANPHA